MGKAAPSPETQLGAGAPPWAWEAGRVRELGGKAGAGVELEEPRQERALAPPEREEPPAWRKAPAEQAGAQAPKAGWRSQTEKCLTKPGEKQQRSRRNTPPHERWAPAPREAAALAAERQQRPARPKIEDTLARRAEAWMTLPGAPPPRCRTAPMALLGRPGAFPAERSGSALPRPSWRTPSAPRAKRGPRVIAGQYAVEVPPAEAPSGEPAPALRAMAQAAQKAARRLSPPVAHSSKRRQAEPWRNSVAMAEK